MACHALCIDVGAAFNQRSRGKQVATRSTVMQGCPAVFVAVVGIGAVLEEVSDNVLVAVVGCF